MIFLGSGQIASGCCQSQTNGLFLATPLSLFMKKPKPIYTITCMVYKADLPTRIQCLGYFHDVAHAMAAVIVNQGGLDCCVYTHCVIEAMLPGVHSIGSHDKPRWWYACNNKRKWKRIRRPKWANGICNWSMG